MALGGIGDVCYNKELFLEAYIGKQGLAHKEGVRTVCHSCCTHGAEQRVS